MGKGSSKLKRKNRAQSMAWNFRFPSMTSLSMRRKGTSIGIHMSIKQWLTILNLNQYEVLFENFKGVEDVMRYTDEDLSDLGVKNEVHRTKMVKSLVALKNKYEQRLNKTGAVPTDLSACHSSANAGSNSACDKTVQRHSVAVDPMTLIKHCPTESDILVIKNFNQSKSLNNIKMEAVTPDPDMDATQLKKMLEWELSLDTRDLRSHAWYHGAIPRNRAEEIVSENDGDFLVRDCTSQPGNYVLSCRSKNQNLHFVISKIVLQPDTVYERVQYRFEEDGYDTVPDLITYYVGSGKPITIISGAKIHTPRNRLYPLSFYANKYELQQQYALNCNNRTSSPVIVPSGPSSPNVVMAANLLQHNHHHYNRSSFRSPASSPPQIRKDKFAVTNSVCSQSEMANSIPKLPSKKYRSLSLSPWESQSVSLSLSQDNNNDRLDDDNGNGDVNVSSSESRKYRFSNSLPRHSISYKIQTVPNVDTTMPRNKSRNQNGRISSNESELLSNGTKNDDTTDEQPIPPPKPSRTSSYVVNSSSMINYKQDFVNHHCSADISRKNSLYHTSGGSDSGNGSGDSMSIINTTDGTDCATPVSTIRRCSSAGGGVIIKNPKYFCQQGAVSAIGSLTTLKAAYSYDTVFEDENFQFGSSAFDLENFHTLLLPMAENKPLDSSALQGIRMLLQDSGSRILANHLTRTDIELTLNEKYYPKVNDDDNYKTMCYCGCGIELCVLPHGHQLRLDLIERTNCVKLLVAVTILTCASDSERAEMLNKWISVAIDTKTALGNLFGFSSIMLGLCMPQIERLASTWHIMRQKFTDSAFNFEAKLRPTLKSMNEGTNPLAPNTTIPHLMPAILLYEQTFDDVVLGHAEERNDMITCWENSSSDLGLSTLHTHLENSRHYCRSLSTFKRNTEIVLSDSKIDDLLLDMFRTEFHLKFLWGSRGASVCVSERYSKFEQVLDVMSEKCEPSSTIENNISNNNNNNNSSNNNNNNNRNSSSNSNNSVGTCLSPQSESSKSAVQSTAV